MKNSFTLLTLITAASAPAAFAADIAGVQFPGGIDAGDISMGYVVAFALLIAFADYAKPRRVGRVASRRVLPPSKSAHPLAA